MKKIMIYILLAFICGCDSLHGLAWYQQGKTIEQARKDCDECNHITTETIGFVNFSNSFGSFRSFEECMEIQGYKLYPVNDLIKGGKQIQTYNKKVGVVLYRDVASEPNQILKQNVVK
jgi:hypothetical protein